MIRTRSAVAVALVALACQPTRGFQFRNPSPTRRIVYLLESASDTLGVEGNAACARMRPLRTPIGIVDTVHVMPDSNLTVMIAFGSYFSDEARYCFIATTQGSRRADTLYLRGDTAFAHARGGVVILQLYPALELIRRQ